MNRTISNVIEGSPAHNSGIEKGDLILSINGKPVRDVIDYMFYLKDDHLNFNIQRGGKEHHFKIKKKENEGVGVELKPFKTKSCRNKCIFCFVDQMPKGLRKSLYLKDDDYRMSFLYGNYITLTNLSPADKQRIVEQKLSPLYISVHTTDNDLRRKMLGNAKAPNILTELLQLSAYKIKMHLQIVLCHGINDGEELTRTIKDLQKFYPHVASIARRPDEA